MLVVGEEFVNSPLGKLHTSGGLGLFVEVMSFSGAEKKKPAMETARPFSGGEEAFRQ